MRWRPVFEKARKSLVSVLAVSILIQVFTLGGCAGGSGGVRGEEDQSMMSDDMVLHHLERIRAARLDGTVEQLRDEYGELLTQAPKDPASHVLFARTLDVLNDAFRQYQSAVELDGRNYWARIGLAEVYLEMGILSRALEELLMAVDVAPQHPHAHCILGDTYRNEGQNAEAQKSYMKALELEPDNIRARRNLGEVLLAGEGDKEGALRELSSIFSHYPEDHGLHLVVANLLEGANRIEEAVGLYRQTTKIKDDLADAWMGLGRVELQLDNKEQAAQAFQKVLDLQPSDMRSRRKLAEIHREQGNCNKAIGLYNELVGAQPEDMTVRRGLAHCLEQEGRQADALMTWRNVMNNDPENGDAKVAVERIVGEVGAQMKPTTGRNLQQVFDSNLHAIISCYNQAKSSENGGRPKGNRMVIRVNIDKEGSATSVVVLSDEVQSQKVRACALWQIWNAAYPATQPASVDFPLEF